MTEQIKLDDNNYQAATIRKLTSLGRLYESKDLSEQTLDVSDSSE
jgi:hypothetical protein